MATIINFPVKNTKGYENLVKLFAVCRSVESCDFYLGTAEYMEKHGQIKENEFLTLRRIGRTKRQELANPIKTPQIAKKARCLQLYTGNGRAKAGRRTD